MVKSVIMSAGLVSLVGLMQVLGISFTAWIPPFPERITSTFGNPNFLGSFLAITLPLSAATFLNSSKEKKLAYLAVFLAGFVALLLTKSRGAIVASILSFLMMFGIVAFGRLRGLVQKTKPLALLGLLVIATLVVFILMDSGAESITKRFSETSSGEGSLFYRLKIWESTVNLIRHNFLSGTGIGTFQIYFPQYAIQDFYRLVPIGNLLHAENEYLEIWSETGILGLGLFLWIILAVFYRAFKFIRTNAEPGQTVLALGLLTGMFAGLAQGLVCVSLRWTGPDFFFWLSLALLMVLIPNSQKPKDVNESGLSVSNNATGIKKIALYSIVAVLTAIFGIWQVKGYSANIYLARAQSYMSSQDKVKAIVELEQAYRRNPHCLEAIFLLGCLNLELQRYSDSENWFARLENLAPDYGNMHEWEGLLFYNTGRLNLAEREYEKAIRMNGSSINHNSLGEVSAAQGKLDLAEKEFEKAEQTDSSAVAPQLNLAKFYLSQKKYDLVFEKGEKGG